MAWWIWVLGGLGLLAAEMATPGGFFVFFFGLGALVVGALAAFGLSGPPWMEWLLFSAFSVLGVLVFREPLMRRFRLAAGKGSVDTMENEVAIVLEDVAPGGSGKAEMRGTSWSARTSGGATLAKGQRCRVQRVEGLTLWLLAE